MAMMLEIRSDRVPAPHTPFKPKKFGKRSSRGISKNTCLKSPKNAAFFASPIAYSFHLFTDWHGYEHIFICFHILFLLFIENI
jgi:hypothetical protein